MTSPAWHLRPIKQEEYDALYTAHIETNFPSSERPSRNALRYHMQHDLQEVFILTNGEEDVGYCVCAKAQNIVLVSLLAIYDGHREKGYGSVLLACLQEHYADLRGILLEIEDPNDAETPEDVDIRNRRMAFYKRAGYHLLDDIEHLCFDVPLLPMALPLGDSLTALHAAAVDDLTAIYHTILPKPLWNQVLTRFIR